MVCGVVIWAFWPLCSGVHPRVAVQARLEAWRAQPCFAYRFLQFRICVSPGKLGDDPVKSKPAPKTTGRGEGPPTLILFFKSAKGYDVKVLENS